MSVSNQNLIIIHREMPNTNFLQIKNENWQGMLKSTHDTHAFALYLYFASNANNYKLEISPQAIENAIGMPRSTYYKKFQLLQEKGYIIQIGKNLYSFYETPQKQTQNCGCPPTEQQNLPQKKICLQNEQNCLPNNIEIDNIYNIDNINIDKQQPSEFIF